jgi:bla regulator protein blaR1
MNIRSLSVLIAVTSASAVADAAPPGHVESYVLLRGDNHTTMSGDMRELERVKKLRQSPTDRLVWFRFDGREYVIRDPAMIAQAEATWKPVEVLGGEMGKLGGKQGELGAKQGEVGAEMGKLGGRMGELGGELGELEARQPTTKAERKSIRKRKRAIEREMHDLEDQMQAMQGQMSPYEAPMLELGKQMEALGKKLEAASKKATIDFDAMLARAIANGTAKRL